MTPLETKRALQLNDQGQLRHFLSLDGLRRELLTEILDTADSFLEVGARAVKKVPLLRGKTISQPTTVMIMTHMLELKPGEKVFEIGTGSGYQAAIIAKIVGHKGKVVTTEVVPELVSFSKQNLKFVEKLTLIY